MASLQDRSARDVVDAGDFAVVQTDCDEVENLPYPRSRSRVCFGTYVRIMRPHRRQVWTSGATQVWPYNQGPLAGVAQLVDAPALGAGGLMPLGVRVPPPALSITSGTQPLAVPASPAVRWAMCDMPVAEVGAEEIAVPLWIGYSPVDRLRCSARRSRRLLKPPASVARSTARFL
jgi:hypothetical protein